MTTDPKLYLAIDNCFASKRWTRPSDWMDVIQRLGITYVEASADTECDPLYMSVKYCRDWAEEVVRCSQRTGVRVINLYSGHGTYSTLGLAHTNDRVRLRFRDLWMKSQADTARLLGAGLGFFAHAIHDPALQDPQAYARTLQTLRGDLANLAHYAASIGLSAISLEQMYSPHQPPWTIRGTQALLQDVYQMAEAPLYVTLDVGHMNGQQYFQKPSRKQISAWMDEKAAGRPRERIWLGPEKAMKIFADVVAGDIQKEAAIAQIEAVWEGYDHLFAAPKDCHVSAWLEALGAHSPIIHLQQNDGKSSPHWPFSSAYNAQGIIDGKNILHALARAYESPAAAGMPPVCEKIALTLEPFIPTAGNNFDALEQISESVQYWRRFLPKDGMRLSEALARI